MIENSNSRYKMAKRKIATDHKKENPHYKFAEWQYREINKEFYENYQESYYFLKMSNLIRLSQAGDGERAKLYSLKSEGIEIIADYDKSTKEIDKFVSTEIQMTLFQCLETYLRMYIAHSALSPCANLQLVQLDLQKYRKQVNKIIQGKFNGMAQQFSDDEVLAKVFFGSMETLEKYAKLNEKEINEILMIFKENLIYAANFVRDNSEYNTFKHGFYLSQLQPKISLKNEAGELSQDGDAFSFIKLEKNKEGYRQFIKVTKWFSPKLSLNIALAFERYTVNMLELWKAIYSSNGKQIQIQVCQQASISFLLDTVKTSGFISDTTDRSESISIKQMSFPYAYYRKED
ncbi:hypothetical protein [Lactococcus lactis]